MERQPQPRPQLIDLTPEHATQLNSLVHSYMELERKGYIMSQLSKESLDKKRRCGQCNKVLSSKTLKSLNMPPVAAITREVEKNPESAAEGALGAVSLVPASASTSESAQQLHSENFKSRPNQRGAKKHNGCSFHPGRVGRDRLWSCCGGYPMSQPCRQENNHVELVYSKGELEANWWFEHTPCRSRGSSPALVAVAVDCEMGTAESGESELIRVSMIDYFTGSVLVDSLVWPDVPMAHFNTRFSGVTRQAMNEARRRRACLFGRHGARRAIWNHVGPETVVVGHSLNSDLTSLRWIHHRVVDTLMVEDPFARADRERLEKLEAAHAAVVLESKENKQPVPPAPKGQHPGCSLKSLTKAYLKRDIQLRGRGHDSLEDATATRDLLHWHIVNRMPTPKAPDAQDGW